MKQKAIKGYVVVDDATHELIDTNIYKTEELAKKDYPCQLICPCTAYYWIDNKYIL